MAWRVDGIAGTLDCAANLTQFILEMVQDCLVHCIVEMSVKHVGHRRTIRKNFVLAVIEHDRIMAQDNMVFFVADFTVSIDPFKARVVKLRIIDIVVMISDQQGNAAVKLF